MRIDLTVSDCGGRIGLTTESPPHLSLAGDYVGSALPEYQGPYSITPGASAQTLATEGRAMTADVTIGAIPSNYGLITWTGSTLLVS